MNISGVGVDQFKFGQLILILTLLTITPNSNTGQRIKFEVQGLKAIADFSRFPASEKFMSSMTQP